MLLRRLLPRLLGLLAATTLFGTITAHAADPGWTDDWDALLKRYVSADGVRYAAWHASTADREALTRVTSAIATTDPAAHSPAERKALLINAYNAWMIAIVLQAYPIRSVTELGADFAVFKEPRARLGGQAVSLDHIEKTLLLPVYRDARIHAAVNCASRSCPPLAATAFRGATIDQQLEQGARTWASHPTAVRQDPPARTLHVSALFQWYADDFRPDGGTLGFLNRYRPPPQLPSGWKIAFQDYDWSLNTAA